MDWIVGTPIREGHYFIELGTGEQFIAEVQRGLDSKLYFEVIGDEDQHMLAVIYKYIPIEWPERG